MRVSVKPGLVFFLLLAWMTACGTQQGVLRTTLAGLNAAREGFVAWDAVHQQQLVEGATSLEDGTNKLRAYRQAREKVTAAFTLGYQLLAAAALDPNDLTLGTALRAAGDIYEAVRKLTGGAVAGGP